MINQIYDSIEQVLRGIDVGGEQSRAFEKEVQILKQVLGYPKPAGDMQEQMHRQDVMTHKLRRLASQAQGLKADLPALPIDRWFDGTVEDPSCDLSFKKYDLSKLLRFIADVGVSSSM